MAEGFALILVVATIFAFLARKTGQPTLIAYILTGIVLGPIVFDVTVKSEVLNVLSELGLAFLLFLIGMEIRFDEIKEFLSPVVKISAVQMLLTAGIGFGLAYLFGFGVWQAVIVGVAVMYGSTAIIVKLLTDKREHVSTAGKIDIGVLLMQDIVVVIIMALLASSAATMEQFAVTMGEVFLLLAVIGGITIASSRYVLPTLFKSLSEDLHIFLIHGIAWCFLFVSVAEHANLSIEIGAFLAGLGMAQLPHSSELQERVRPLTDLFMALFFINFGLGLEAGALTVYWQEALIASGVLMAGKFVIMFAVVNWQQFTPQTSFVSAVNMVQTSEFSLVLAWLAREVGYIGDPVVGFISIIAITSMGVSTYAIKYNHVLYRWAEPWLERFEAEHKTDIDTGMIDNHAVIVGYGVMSRRLVPILEEFYDDILIVDRNPDNVRSLKHSRHRFIYGDIRHQEIREAARIQDAALVISFAHHHAINLRLLDETHDEAIVFLRATTLEEATELYELGADYVTHKKILATNKLIEYLQDYLNHPERFRQEIGPDTEAIWWKTEYEQSPR